MMMTNYRWVQGFHLNAQGVLFGGNLLAWADEDCTMLAYNSTKEEDRHFTTLGMDRVRFVAPVTRGERLRFNYVIRHIGTTSITVACKVFSKTKDDLKFRCLTTLVRVDESGKPIPIGDILKESVSRSISTLKDTEEWSYIEGVRMESKKPMPESL